MELEVGLCLISQGPIEVIEIDMPSRAEHGSFSSAKTVPACQFPNRFGHFPAE